MGVTSTTFEETREGEIVIDSGASMHMLSRKDLSFEELDTFEYLKKTATVITDNGEV